MVAEAAGLSESAIHRRANRPRRISMKPSMNRQKTAARKMTNACRSPALVLMLKPNSFSGSNSVPVAVGLIMFGWRTITLSANSANAMVARAR